MQLTGTIATELGLLTRLESFSLQNTGIGGTIPSELGRFTSPNFWMLNLGDNSLTGAIPTQVYSLQAEQFWLSENMLEGSLATEIGLATNASKCAVVVDGVSNGIVLKKCDSLP